MKFLHAAAVLGLASLTACVATKSEPSGSESSVPTQFNPVPGPSASKAALPPAPVPEPEPPPATNTKAEQSPAKASPPIITPDTSLIGKVARYNEAGRFVVLEFPIARMPGNGQKLFVYRNTLKVGEVKITGPQRDDRTVADLTTGEAQPGDEVREQ